MNYNPLVSIICLCYNHEKFVPLALQSVIDQTYPNIELIIVDDCSNDGSSTAIKEWLRQHPEIVFIENTSNKGNTK